MHTRNVLVGIALLALLPAVAHAILVTPDTNAMNLANIVTGGGGAGLIVTSATLSAHGGGAAASSGTYTNLIGTYWIGNGIVLSSGNVADYATGPNTVGNKSTDWGVGATASEILLLDPIAPGKSFFDVTQLDITFDMQAGFNTVYFNVVWGTEEYAEWIGSAFIDAFGLYVNGTNIAMVDGKPINVDHPWMEPIAGTELDGILDNGNPYTRSIPHLFSYNVGDGSKNNTLTFIIADTGDGIYDATVYVAQLGGSEPPPPKFIPEPMTLAGVFLGVAGLAGYIRRRRMA